ncbi:c-type cytochrome [Rhodocaloribacter sp.]
MKRLFTMVSLAALLALPTSPAQAQERTGVEIWSQSCGNCHTAQPPVRYTADQWESIVVHMTISARLTDEEMMAVKEFLESGARKMADASERKADTFLAASDPEVTQEILHSEKAAKLYASYCATCHGNEGRGNGPVAKALQPKPRNLVDPEFQKARSDEELFEVILEGKGAMPGFKGQLNESQVHALVRYLRALAQKKEKK